LEPAARNTTAAIAAAAKYAERLHPEAILLVMPSDHVVDDVVAFQKAINDAIGLAETGLLVTFGIEPSAPETGFGYIELGKKIGKAQDKAGAAFEVASFSEKPKLEVAQQMLASGKYLWNAGIFMFRVSTFLDALTKFQPELEKSVDRAVKSATEDIDFLRLASEPFSECKSISVDHAIMEKAKNIAVVPVSCGWSDVGSWSALWQVKPKNEQGNSVPENAINVNTKNTLVMSKRLVATVGVQNLIIVDTDDALLIADQSAAQDIKIVVEQLRQQKSASLDFHRKVLRPWGAYDSIDSAERFQVKRITVKPGASLSLQMHHHRAEHWIVVSGTARITKGDETFNLFENQSTYIPIGEKHRLENPGKIDLELIEVQSGAYLGEDDIVRFQDVYGR
jgi:mannose-1-phosphate guanylyltransferase/mannose-6-phosphate isomerase